MPATSRLSQRQSMSRAALRSRLTLASTSSTKIAMPAPNPIAMLTSIRGAGSGAENHNPAALCQRFSARVHGAQGRAGR